MVKKSTWIFRWELKHGKIPQRAVVLLRTGWESRWGDVEAYLGIRGNSTDDTFATNLNYPGFDVSAARYLGVERQVRGVGIDTVGIDPGNSRVKNTFKIYKFYYNSMKVYSFFKIIDLY